MIGWKSAPRVQRDDMAKQVGKGTGVNVQQV
jgi:hypothetical protein